MSRLFLKNIASSLAMNNKRLQFKNGSFLNNVGSSEVYSQLGDKLLFEISMFKNELYPVMKFFKGSLDSLLSTKKPEAGVIDHVVYTLPVPASMIMSQAKIQPSTNRFVHRTLLKTYDSMINLDDVTDVAPFFITEKSPATQGLQVILEKMGIEEVKKFISEYCTILYDNGDEEIYSGRKSYRVFGRTGVSALIHLQEICLLWGFLQVRLHEENGSSNVSRENELEIIRVALEEVESLIALGLGVYEEYVKEKIVVFDDPARDNGNRIYVMDDVLGELIERSTQDPWTAMFGSHSEIVSLFKQDVPAYRTVDDIINNESEYIRYYNRVQEINAAKEREAFIQMVKRQLLVFGREAYDGYITEDMKEYTSSRHAEDFVSKIVEYVKTIDDDTLISNSALITSVIIGKILFDRTYFWVFLESQTELSDIVENFDIREENETTLWVINFLVRFLVESLEVVHG